MSYDVERESRFGHAQVALEEFFARVDSGEALSFDSWSAEHGEIAEELRCLHALCSQLRSRDGAKEEQPFHDAAPSRVLEKLERLASGANHFGDYTVAAQPIAEGGMGSILDVRDGVLERSLAMKVLRSSGPGASGLEPRRVTRFLDEARITSQLDHPGIVPVHELGIDPAGRPYFTMKRVRGRTLEEVFERASTGHADWPRARVLGLLQRVCEAVAFAHQNGVIHRDLKPSNVMVGDFGEVYVMDWGLARVVDRTSASTDSESKLRRAEADGEVDEAPELGTQDGDVIGTPAYMAPEQAAGKRAEVGRHSDVYSVGAMLYQLLAGHAPYSGARGIPSPRRVVARLLEGPPRPLEQVAPDAPPELTAICAKAMHRDWRRRYSDMAALSIDLTAYIEGRVVEVYETGAWAETRKWVQRNKALAMALGGAVVILVGGVITSLNYAREANRNADAAEAARIKADAQAALATASKETAERREAEALSSARRAKRVTEFVETALKGSDPSEGGNEGYLVVDAMHAALRDLDGGALKDDPETEAHLEQTIALVFGHNLRYDEAVRLSQRALETRRRLYQADHDDLADSLQIVAICLNNAGRPDEALPYAEAALTMCQRLHPGDHTSSAACIDIYAACLTSLGRGVEALPQHESALSMRLRLDPGDSLGALISLLNIAKCLVSLGRPAEALPRFESALEMCRRLYPGAHPITATALTGVASALGWVGRHAEALSLAQASLEMRRRLYTGDHPSVVLNLKYVANCLETLHRSEEGLRSAEAALEMCQRLSKEDNFNTADCLFTVATSLGSLGRPAEALEKLDAALEMNQRLGRGHGIEAANIMAQQASCLDSLGMGSKAASIHAAALEMYERIRPVDLATVARAHANYGYCLYGIGRPDMALHESQTALETWQRLYPGDHSEVVKSLANVGASLIPLGRNEEALSKLQASVEMCRRLHPEDNSDTAGALSLLASCLRELGRIDEALTHYEVVMQMCRRLHPGDDPDLADSIHEVAYCRVRLDRFSEALPLAEEALAMRQRLYPQGHADVAASLSGVGLCLQALGRPADALPLFKEALAIQERVQEARDNDQTAIALFNLARCLDILGACDEALFYIERADAMAAKVLPDEHAFRQACSSKLASIRENLTKVAGTAPEPAKD